MRSFLSLVLPALAIAGTVREDTAAVCQELYDEFPQYVAYDPLGPNALQTARNASIYRELNTVYWNAASRLDRAACAFFPDSAEQVSAAVKSLNKYPNAKFALKSGGHQPARGFSSTDGGVLISFAPNLNSVVRTDNGERFIVGSGARWGDVYRVTEQTRQIVVGGRLSHIGVGGFALGGGLSYYSAQYGLTCDNVDQFEVVLADGTVAMANRDENSDLWWALRGGGNQFAIVTRFWMQAHPLGDGKIWGGIRSYHPSKRRDLFKAITNFVRDYPDEKAAVIPTFQFGLPANLINALAGPLFFFFYDGTTPPPGVFDEFDAIDSLSDSTDSFENYSELTDLAGGGAPFGFGASFREVTFPNMADEQMADFYDEVYKRVSTQSFRNSLTDLNVQVMGFAPQPLSVRIANVSNALGGNALGLDPNDGDRIWIENSLIWTGDLCNRRCPENSKEVMDGILAYHKRTFNGVEPTNFQGDDVESASYNPLFLNDVAADQDVYSSYGAANLAKLQAAKRKYDPTGFFTDRQGGFKLP